MHTGQVPCFTMPDGLEELAADLELTWPQRLAELRASGVPLNADDDDDSGDDSDDSDDADSDDDDSSGGAVAGPPR